MNGLERSATIVGVAALLMGGCRPPLQEPEPIGAEDFHVLGIAPGMAADGINEALGGGGYSIEVVAGAARGHNRIIVFSNSEVAFTVAEYEDEAAETIGMRVERVRLTGPGVPTARGLRVGDSVSRVRRLYGAPVSIREGVWLYLAPGASNERYAMEIEVKSDSVASVLIERTPAARQPVNVMNGGAGLGLDFDIYAHGEEG